MTKKVIIQRDIKKQAVRDVHAPACRVVDEKMTAAFERSDFNLPRPTNLIRQMNRARQKIRLQEPTSLDFERKVQEVGLQATYQRREGAHLLIRKLLALPFLPGRDISRAFLKLRDRADCSSRPLRDLFECVNDQWITSSLWSTDEWSVYRQPERTNNDAEGWHRRLNQKAGRGKLQLYVLLSLLLQEAKLVPWYPSRRPDGNEGVRMYRWTKRLPSCGINMMIMILSMKTF